MQEAKEKELQHYIGAIHLKTLCGNHTYLQLKMLVMSLKKNLQQDFSNLTAKIKGSNNSPQIDKITTSAIYIKSDVDENIPEITTKNDNKFALIIGNEDYSSYQTGP